MLFNSLHFIWFFVVVYAVYRLLPHRAQNWLLLIANTSTRLGTGASLTARRLDAR